MSKSFYFLCLVLVTISCCQDHGVEPITVVPNCDNLDCPILTEFFGVGLMNGQCWSADATYIDPLSSSSLSITLGKNEINGIGENLRFIINDVTNLADTIWLGWTDVTMPVPNVAEARYFYTESHSSAGKFDFAPDSELTYSDFLIIDYINEDTSIVEGHFQVNFSRKLVSNLVVNAPDSMNLQCGQFKSKEF